MKKISVEVCDTPEKAKDRRKRYSDIYAEHSVEGCIIYAWYSFCSEPFDEEEQAKKFYREMESQKDKGYPMRWEYLVAEDVVNHTYYVVGNCININCL